MGRECFHTCPSIHLSVHRGGTPARSSCGGVPQSGPDRGATALGYPPGQVKMGVPQPWGACPSLPPPRQVRTRGYPRGHPPQGTSWPGQDGGTPARGCPPGVPSQPGQDWGCTPARGHLNQGTPLVRTGHTPTRGHRPQGTHPHARSGQGVPQPGAPTPGYPPGQVRTGGYPSQGGTCPRVPPWARSGWGIPPGRGHLPGVPRWPGQDRGYRWYPPPPSLRDRTAHGVLDKRRSVVCLLRSRRRTVL